QLPPPLRRPHRLSGSHQHHDAPRSPARPTTLAGHDPGRRPDTTPAIRLTPAGHDPGRLLDASRPPAGRRETGIPVRSNALDPGFHGVPAGPAHLNQDADGAGVT